MGHIVLCDPFQCIGDALHFPKQCLCRINWSTPIPGGESYELLSARVGRWLESVKRDTVVVSHGGVSRCLRGIVSEIPSIEVPRLEVPQDKVLKIEGNQFEWV